MSFDLYTLYRADYRDKFVEIYTFYNFPNIFDKLWNYNSLALQNKMFQDFLFLTIDYKNYGVACGSSIPNCPVMWGHYADNHKGMCLEFQLLDEKGNDSFCYSRNDSYEVGTVEYTDEPIDILNMPLMEVAKVDFKLLTTKSKRWSYENEVRLIRPKQGFLKFNRKNIKAAIFGSRTTPKDRYSVCKLLVCLGYKCPFFFAKMQPDIYEMKIDPMILNDVAAGGFQYWDELNFNS